MKYKILLSALLGAATLGAQAQRGMLDNAVGVRLGLGSGVSFQHFFTDKDAMELIAYQRFGGANFTALYQTHMQMFDIRGLKWYCGAGGHVWLYNRFSVLNENAFRTDSYALGVDGIVGMEVFMRSLPLQFSIDWKPGFNLMGSHYIEWDSGGISARYRF